MPIITVRKLRKFSLILASRKQERTLCISLYVSVFQPLLPLVKKHYKTTVFNSFYSHILILNVKPELVHMYTYLIINRLTLFFKTMSFYWLLDQFPQHC